MGQTSCSCGVPPPQPPVVVAPSGPYPYDAHPKSQPEVCISCSGMVIGCHFFVMGIDQVTSCCSSRPHLALVKSVKTKPPEVVLLVLPPLRVASRRHHRRVWLATQCLSGTFFPSFKSQCKPSKKLKWCPPSHAPVCLSPSYLPRIPAAIDWSPKMPWVVSLCSSRLRQWISCFAMLNFAWLSSFLATTYLCWL
jgi:hypothetical protein